MHIKIHAWLVLRCFTIVWLQACFWGSIFFHLKYIICWESFQGSVLTSMLPDTIVWHELSWSCGVDLYSGVISPCFQYLSCKLSTTDCSILCRYLNCWSYLLSSKKSWSVVVQHSTIHCPWQLSFSELLQPKFKFSCPGLQFLLRQKPFWHDPVKPLPMQCWTFYLQ